MSLAERIKEECTIERVSLLMNVVPCDKINLAGKTSQHIIMHRGKLHYDTTLCRIVSTVNKIGERGATSLSDALKSNTTLTKLYLGGEDKRNSTQMASVNKPLFPILIKPTGNKIGERGATSLGDALKSNTTLTELDLRGEDKKKHTNDNYQ